LKGIGKTVLVEDMHTRKRKMLEQVISRDENFSGYYYYQHILLPSGWSFFHFWQHEAGISVPPLDGIWDARPSQGYPQH